MGGQFTAGLLFKRLAAADMIRMRMGKDDPGNILRIPASLFDIFQNHRLGAGNAAVNQAYLIAKDEIGKNKSVHRYVRTHTQFKRYFQGMDVFGDLHFCFPPKMVLILFR
jgi:hypothetical protein